MGRDWRPIATIARHPNQTRNHVLHAILAHQHCHHWLRSVAQVEECVQLAREFTPLNDRQMAELADKTEPIARQALFFRLMKR